MNPKVRHFVESEVTSFVDVALMRTFNSGDRSFNFTISANEIKRATDRERLRPEMVAQVTEFIEKRYEMPAHYDEDLASFEIKVDLDSCKLNGEQSRNYLIAVNHHLTG